MASRRTKTFLLGTLVLALGAAVLPSPDRARAEAPDAGSGAPVLRAVREGSAVALSRHEDRLYVASEELRRLLVFALDDGSRRDVPLPGAPANLIVLQDDRVLVTVRDPGLLLVLRTDAGGGLVEAQRVPVPADAWGLAVSSDGATAYVTSAWTHALTAVDLASGSARFALELPREPRGVVAVPGGPLYVSHLTSASLTRVDVTATGATARSVDLPPSPLRTPRRHAAEGSLGYALALSPDAHRLFAPRHALGVVGEQAWFGAATVDVMMLPGEEPLAPPRATTLLEKHRADEDGGEPYPTDPAIDPATGPLPMTTATPFTQPRAIVYRRSTGTLLVAAEGDPDLVELDALALDPTLALVAHHPLGDCAAPSGVALSADESTAYVLCRASFRVVAIGLESDLDGRVLELGPDPLEPLAAAGRRLFYMARRPGLSEGLACSGCHPEGRDDGHVWHEVDTSSMPAPKLVAPRIFAGGFATLELGGVPRQTPMLAGRVGSPGPYGWLGEDADLPARITKGASLHRWTPWHGQAWEERDRKAAIDRLARFLRVGLVPPPRPEAAPTPEQARGKELFERADVGCSGCHVAAPDAPAIVTRLPKLPVREGFDDEDLPLKVPSLAFVGGTPPYLHDGSAATLRALLEGNGSRMGHTGQLSADDRAALAAYLETL